MHKIRAGSNLR